MKSAIAPVIMSERIGVYISHMYVSLFHVPVVTDLFYNIHVHVKYIESRLWVAVTYQHPLKPGYIYV